MDPRIESQGWLANTDWIFFHDIKQERIDFNPKKEARRRKGWKKNPLGIYSYPNKYLDKQYLYLKNKIQLFRDIRIKWMENQSLEEQE